MSIHSQLFYLYRSKAPLKVGLYLIKDSCMDSKHFAEEGVVVHTYVILAFRKLEHKEGNYEASQGS